MLKSSLLFFIALVIIISNNAFFNIFETSLLHIIQVIGGVFMFFYFVISMINVTSDYFPKKYDILLFISFIFAARSTESLVRKYLVLYYPTFYDAYKLYIFGFSIVILLMIVYFVNKKKKASIKEA